MRGGRSLPEELECYLSDWQERTGITVETWALPRSEVAPPVARAVLAVIREALANVERHSRARTVSIAVTAGSGGLRLTVGDDGQGYTAAAPGRGFALMRAGFAEVGGTLSVDSVPGEGTTVHGVVPLRG
jgi:signal transduction histidine kinase